MRMNKKVQYGLLLTLYLCRAGRATIESTAHNMNLSKSFLEQVACQLRKAGVIKSIRGPAGGYELIGAPTVGDVCFAIAGMAIMSPKELERYRRGEFEYRALARLIDDFHFALTPVFKRKVVNVGTELVSAEMRKMDKVNGVAH